MSLAIERLEIKEKSGFDRARTGVRARMRDRVAFLPDVDRGRSTLHRFEREGARVRIRRMPFHAPDLLGVLVGLLKNIPRGTWEYRECQLIILEVLHKILLHFVPNSVYFIKTKDEW